MTAYRWRQWHAVFFFFFKSPLLLPLSLYLPKNKIPTVFWHDDTLAALLGSTRRTRSRQIPAKVSPMLREFQGERATPELCSKNLLGKIHKTWLQEVFVFQIVPPLAVLHVATIAWFPPSSSPSPSAQHGVIKPGAWCRYTRGLY